MQRHRLGAIGVAVAGAALLCAGAGARAASIVYVKGGNVYVAPPDGSTQRNITKTGSAKHPFASPSESDAGDITVVAPAPLRQFVTYRIDGRFKHDAGIGPGGSGLPSSPLEAQVNPVGGFIVYGYIHSDCCYSVYTEVAFANTVGFTGDDVYGHLVDVQNPRWIYNPWTSAGMVSDSGNGVFVTRAGRADAVGWIPAPAGHRIVSFDESRRADRVIAELGPPIDQYSSGESHRFALYRTTGAAPARPALLCTSKTITTAVPEAFPRFSPDGTQISWSDKSGLWVSPTPAGAGCRLRPRLIVKGAAQASWGRMDFPFCTGLKNAASQRCQAKVSHRNAAGLCAKRKTAAQRRRCTAAATVAYHRRLATIRCKTIKSRAKRASCLKRVKKIHR